MNSQYEKNIILVGILNLINEFFQQMGNQGESGMGRLEGLNGLWITSLRCDLDQN
jgi:hypothetical protein